MIDNLAGQVYHLEFSGRTYRYTLRPGEDYTFEFLFQSRDSMVFTSIQEGRDFVEAYNNWADSLSWKPEKLIIYSIYECLFQHVGHVNAIGDWTTTPPEMGYLDLE